MAYGLNPITLRPMTEEPLPDEETVPGALPPLASVGRAPMRPQAGLVQGTPSTLFDDLEQSKAPVIERSLPGEAVAGFARGAGPTALQTLGQAARGVGLEQVGTALRGAGTGLQEAAPRLFRPSTAAQQPNTWANTIATAFESMGTSATLTAPALGLTALSGGGAGPLLAAFALSTPLVYGTAEYQNVYDEGRAAGIPDAVLQAPAFKSALAETGWEFASNVAEALMLRSGLGRGFARGARMRWRQGIKAGMAPAATQTLAEMGITGAAEAVGEGATQYQQEQFRQEVGIPTGPSQVGTAATAGAIAGLTFGILGKGTMRVMRGYNLQALASPSADPQTRMQIANQVLTHMDESGADPDLVAQFRQAAGQAIAQGQPIPLGQDIAGLGVQPTAPETAPTAEEAPPAPSVAPTPAPGAAPLITPGVAGPAIFGQLTQPMQPRPQPPTAPEMPPFVPPTTPGAPSVMDLMQGQVGVPRQYEQTSPYAQPPSEVAGFLEAQRPPEDLSRALPAAPDVSDAALQIVLDAESRGFQGFNYQDEAAQLSRNYQIPLQQAQRVLSEAITAGRQEVQQTAPLVQPGVTQEAQPAPPVEAPPAIQPTAPLVQPRGPQVLAGTSARLASPRPTAPPATAAVTPELQAPEVVPQPTMQPRSPQLPSGTMNRQAIQPVQPTAGPPPGVRSAETPVPPVSEAPLAAPPGPAQTPPAAPTPQAPPPIATPGGSRYPFTYEWVDASETIPSHNPQSFSVNPRYEDVSGMPVGATQDRAYHREPAEQAKVVEQDRQFPERYGFMLSTSPDATHGPPVMPADSNVTIAGNSRLMTILRKIQEPGQPGYQNYLRDANQLATQQGLGPATADMQSPILMRRLTDLSTNDREAMQRASREFNESWTQALSEKAQAVASGKALSAETVAYLGEQLDALGEEATLRDFFRTAAARELIRRLQADGVLTQRTINKYVDDQGMLNEDGKSLVERAILGRVLPDSNLIDAAPAQTINTLIKTLPALVQLESQGDRWNITRHLPEAVQLITDLQTSGARSFHEMFEQVGLFGDRKSPNPVALSLAEALRTMKPTQFRAAVQQFASQAGRGEQGGMIFVAPPLPAGEAFNQAFKADLSPAIYQQAMSLESTAAQAATLAAERDAMTAQVRELTQAIDALDEEQDQARSTLPAGAQKEATIQRIIVQKTALRETRNTLRERLDYLNQSAPSDTPQQFQARPQTQAQGHGEPWTLTPQEVHASFPAPGYRVIELPEGGYRISTQTGYTDLTEVDTVQMGPEQRIAFQMEYGTPFSDDLSVNARFIHENGKSRIELVRGKADRVSLLHEFEHWLELSGQLTPEQIQQLSEATGGAGVQMSDRAEYVAHQLNDRRYRRDTAVGRILDQIWDYLDRLLALVGIHTTRGIIRGIETGQGLNRGASSTDTSAGSAEQFQAQATRPTLETAPTENKLFTEYQSFLNYANPTVEYLFRTNDANFIKQKISLGQMNRESAAILEYWYDHPGEMTRVLRRWQQHQQLPRRDELGALLETGKAYSDVMMAGVREGTLTNEAFIEAKDQLTGPNTIFNIATGMASEWGRIGVMFQQYRPEDRFMQLMIQKQERIGRILTPEEHAAYVAEFNKVAMTGDAAALDKFFGKVKAENPTIWDYLKEFWYGSVLSGFPTWIANPGGNTLWTSFSLGALRPVEAFLDHFIAKAQNRPQQYFMSEVMPSLMGYGRGLAQKERWKALGPGLKTGDFEMPGAAGISKMEAEMEMFSSHWQHATWQLDFPFMRQLGIDMGPVRRALKSSFGIEPGQPINLMRTVAPIVSLGTRVMVGMDHLGRAAAYDGIIQGMVERQVQQELRAGDLTADGVTARKTALLQQAHDGDNPAGEPMRKTAALQAKEFTFQDEKSAIANFILKGRTLPIIGRPFHLLFPFVATADRLIYRALELTPIAGAILHHEELTHWKTAGPALTSVLARQMTGVFISLVMLALFRQGILTGDIPDDPGEREAFLRQGKQPRSFKVGDTYISYQRFEPLNLMLGWLPSMVQAAQRAYERDDQAGVVAIIGTMGAIATKHIIEGSYFSGFNSFLVGLNRPTGDQTESFLSRMVDSWVPFSGARRTITRAWDAYQTGEGAVVRDPKGFFDYISGASLVSDVRPRFNVFGQPIVTPGNVAAQFLPYRISVATHDPVENELARLKIYPGPPSQQDAKGQKLSQADYAFLVQHGGQLVKGKLDRLVQQPYYQQLSEALREKSLHRAILQGRKEAREELAARSRARGFLVGR